MSAITHLYVEETDSTNNELKRRFHSQEPPADRTILSAGHQTAGRGRSGHQWESPAEDSLSTSLIFYPEIRIEHVPRITILAGMAVAAALEKLYGLPAQLKWPNDVLVNEKKICGILCEMEPAHDKAAYVIVGIGVNIHQKAFPEEIRNTSTSVDIELEKCGKPVHSSRRDVDHVLWQEFFRLYETFRETEDLSNLLREYNDRLINVNRTVRVLNPAGEYCGISMGIDPEGDLLVKKESNGEIVRVNSGEVHVRGVDGYV